MRKLLSILLLAALTLSATAQTEHLKFKGIPMEGTVSSYADKLIQSGMTYVADYNNMYMLKGKFAMHDDCDIMIGPFDGSDNVTKIMVVYSKLNRWQPLIDDYSSLKTMLTNKYGEPVTQQESFQGYSEPQTDDMRMMALLNDRCNYLLEYSVPLGIIQLMIVHFDAINGAVVINYIDNANLKQNIMDAYDDL